MHFEIMQKKQHSLYLRYGGALATVAVATVARLLLDPVMQDTRPLVTYLPAIMFAAWAFGSGPTLLAVFASTLAAVYFFFPPRNAFAITSSADHVGLLIFLV